MSIEQEKNIGEAEGCIPPDSYHLTIEEDVEAFFEKQQNRDPTLRPRTVCLDVRGLNMEMVERQICFFYQFLDLHTEKTGKDAYTPDTIIVLSEHEVQEPWSGIQGLEWTTISPS